MTSTRIPFVDIQELAPEECLLTITHAGVAEYLWKILEHNYKYDRYGLKRLSSQESNPNEYLFQVSISKEVVERDLGDSQMRDAIVEIANL